MPIGRGTNDDTELRRHILRIDDIVYVSRNEISLFNLSVAMCYVWMAFL